ncbi:MAG: Flp pilus assembly complex ATPase component TadA [Betaproteobacteria bacterium]|nr:Flp pilus assembly complex ATPase component TadA [Betaproteobacteria bacterium]
MGAVVVLQEAEFFIVSWPCFGGRHVILSHVDFLNRGYVMDFLLIRDEIFESSGLIRAIISVLEFGRAPAGVADPSGSSTWFGEISDIFVEANGYVTARRRNRKVARISEFTVSADVVYEFARRIARVDNVLGTIQENIQRRGLAEIDGMIALSSYRIRFNICLSEQPLLERAAQEGSDGSLVPLLSISIRRFPLRAVPLEKVGYQDKVIPAIKQVLGQQSGIIALSGPTSSGKTISSSALLREAGMQRACRIITIENPPEIPLPSLSSDSFQSPSISVHRAVGEPGGPPTFLAGLMGAKRQNPDIIFVGEARDDETKSMVVDTGAAGMLVMTTLHAPSPVDVVMQLCQASSNQLVANNLLMVIHQVIVPVKHEDKQDDGLSFSSSVLCADVVKISDAARKLIAEGNFTDLRRQFREEYKTHTASSMNDTLLQLLKSGQIDRPTAIAYTSDREMLQA